MSKRVSNKRRSQQQKAPARSTRIRLGFYRKRRIGNVERAMEAHRKKTVLGAPMDDESKAAMKALNKVLSSLMPKKKIEHRGVR